MRRIWPWATVVLVVLTTSALAQQTVRIQLELRQGDSVVARPSLSLAPGGEGTLEIEGIGTVKIAATLLESDRLSLAFDIKTPSRQFKPRLVLASGSTGTVSIAPDEIGGESVSISATWQR